MVNRLLSISSSSSSTIAKPKPNGKNSSNNSTKNNGLASRLFKRKQHPPPLCKQDSCSIDDEDDNDNNNNNEDMSMSHSNASSSIYSISSEKENKSHKTKQQKSKFIDINSSEFLNNNLQSLVSPSGVTNMPLRKVPLVDHLKSHDMNIQQSESSWLFRQGSIDSGIEEDDDHDDEQEGRAEGEAAFDLNVPQSFSDSDFDIPSFQNLGCNPFHQTTLSLSPPWKQKIGLGTGTGTNKNQPEIVEMESMNNSESQQQQQQQQQQLQQNQENNMDNDNKRGFLKQMKIKMNRQLSKSMTKQQQERGSSSLLTTRNEGKGSLPPKNSVPTKSSSSNDDDYHNKTSLFKTSDETPKFTNKSMNNNNSNNNDNITAARSPKSLSKNNSSNRTDMEKTIFTRSALSRPFGRTSLPSQLAKQWCVEVSPFYDEAVKCWKYHILVQREEYSASQGGNNSFLSPVKSSSTAANNGKSTNTSSPNNVIHHPASSPPSNSNTGEESFPTRNKSFTAATVTRTLKDIAWLERALRDEYHGALIFPTLSMTLTSGTDWTTTFTSNTDSFERGEWDPYHLSNELLNVVLEEEEYHDEGQEEDGSDERSPPFDTKLISDWFNDVLNGVRGKGEVILNYGRSRSVDVMHSESMECFLYKVNEPLVDLHFMKKKKSTHKWLSFGLDFRKLTLNTSESRDASEDFAMMKGLMTFPVFCLSNISTTCNPSDEYSEHDDSIISKRTKSRTKQQSPEYWQRSILPEDLKVQSYYIGIQRENVLLAMYRLRILLETEGLVSVAWKRFAISLSNLFTAGKDIESCKVGDSKGKKKGHKVRKEKVDDCLRILARQKVDRATPSLKVLSGMLSAYYADFSSVNPSLHAYSDGIEQLENEKASIITNSEDKWKQALKAVSPLTLFHDTDGVRDSHALEMEIRVFEQRHCFNESLIKSSVSQLCNSIDVRVSRMSWKFFKMESGQATLLSNAADQVQNELGGSVDTPFNLNVIGEEGEVDLVRRLMDLGSKRKYKYHPYPKSCSSSHTGSESDLISENGSAFMDDSVTDVVSTHNPIIEKLIDRVKKCDGRWDSKLALGILEMTGIENCEIIVQDAPREVRTVQRLADSLKVQIDRCNEAIAMLRELAYGHGSARLVKHRHEFLSDLAVVFSGSMYSKSHRKSRDLRKLEKKLSKEGINSHDSFGWLTMIHDSSHYGRNDNGRCGEVASKYEHKRELGTHQLLEQIEEILRDQCDRVERMESFVFMYCVGNQLEKHFSRLRAEALAAWEKKTDITTAINIATKKRLPLLVNELKSKLASLSPISHTSVKEAKERHLGSKALKAELEALASNRFEQLKQSSTDGVIEAIIMWAKHEKNTATTEISALGEAIKEIEHNLRRNDKIIEADGGAHLFASSGIS